MKLKTDLLSGAGNTFHICYSDNWAKEVPSLTRERMKSIVKKICSEAPADGFIFLEKTKTSEFKWFFFNNDGSDAEMCGNATRCVGYYIKNILKNVDDRWSLLTVAGPIKIEFISMEKFKITMTAIVELNSNQGFFCDTGVPHLVIETESLKTDEVTKQEARKLRFHADFSPRGTNVTYVVLKKEINKIQAVSYERGVEDFTAACGTGAMAAAFYNLTKRAVRQTEVEMPGGTLIMDLSDLSQPTMTGPAILMGSFEHEVSI